MRLQRSPPCQIVVPIVCLAAAAKGGSTQQASLIAGRVRRYAWGEHIGWINLDDSINFVATTCYAHCHGSTATPVLTGNDFQCFLDKFAASDPLGNCDVSTSSPILNVNDFQCFLNKYAAGCP